MSHADVGASFDRLFAASTPTELYDASVEAAQHILEADTSEIAAVEDGEPQVLARKANHFSIEPDSLPIGTDIVGQTDLIGRSHVYDDITDVRSAAAAQPIPDTDTYTPRSLLLVPIDSVGLLIATSATAGAFSEADRTWAEQLAAFIDGMVAVFERSDASEEEITRLEQIARILSHDFAGPLTVARGALELAQETDDEQYFLQVRKAIDRIEDLVEGIERLARTEEHIGQVELIELRSAVEEVWPALQTNDSSIDVVDSRRILADEQAFYQLLMNLFNNAVEHGGHDVSIRVGTTQNGFYIEDDGPGLPAGVGDEIFDWGHTSSSDHKGIGLSIVDRIISAHDWEISMSESELGGVRFDITGLTGTDSPR